MIGVLIEIFVTLTLVWGLCVGIGIAVNKVKVIRPVGILMTILLGIALAWWLILLGEMS